MAQADDLKKLAVLLPHWAEHNADHAEEFRDWAGRAERLGYAVAAAHVRAAADAMEQANVALSAALESLRGGST